MRIASLIASILLGAAATASAQGAYDPEITQEPIEESPHAEPVYSEPAYLEPAFAEPDANAFDSESTAQTLLALSDAQHALRAKARRQIGTTPVLLVVGAASLLPIAFSGFPEGGCESNKRQCSSVSAGDYSSVGDDFAAAVSFAGASAALSGTAMLLTIGARNRQLGRGDFQSPQELQEARGRMLLQYGQRTRWAGAGLMIAGATAALTGGVLSLAYLGKCEVGDCRVVPGSIKTLFVSVGITAVTGGMMMAVGARTMRHGNAFLDEPRIALSVSPWFDQRGGGATLAMTW